MRTFPVVNVPVLSNATTVTACASSSASASLIRMPWRAATPVPAISVVGVARPSAQGQAITSTATAWISAASTPAPLSIQPAKVMSAVTITAGTNTALTWSTSRWIGALAACASSEPEKQWYKPNVNYTAAEFERVVAAHPVNDRAWYGLYEVTPEGVAEFRANFERIRSC